MPHSVLPWRRPAVNPSYLTSDPSNSERLLSVVGAEPGQPLPKLVQLVYLPVQNIHELLELALHPALLLSAVVYIHLEASYSLFELSVLHLCSLWTENSGGGDHIKATKRNLGLKQACRPTGDRRVTVRSQSSRNTAKGWGFKIGRLNGRCTCMAPDSWPLQRVPSLNRREWQLQKNRKRSTFAHLFFPRLFYWPTVSWPNELGPGSTFGLGGSRLAFQTSFCLLLQKQPRNFSFVNQRASGMLLLV